MKKRSLFVGFISIFLFVGLNGCINNDNSNSNNGLPEGDLDPSLFGGWLFSRPGQEFIWIISSDGTFNYNGQNGSWVTNNGILTIIYQNTNTPVNLYYSFSDNGNKLITRDDYNNYMNYTKQ